MNFKKILLYIGLLLGLLFLCLLCISLLIMLIGIIPGILFVAGMAAGDNPNNSPSVQMFVMFLATLFIVGLLIVSLLIFTIAGKCIKHFINKIKNL